MFCDGMQNCYETQQKFFTVVSARRSMVKKTLTRDGNSVLISMKVIT